MISCANFATAPTRTPSELVRSQNLAACGEPDVADFSAAYGFGIFQNRAVVDGTKRDAFLSVGVFRALNGNRLVATQAASMTVVLALAAGELDKVDFAGWLREHLVKRKA